jgi:spermidine synthase
MQPWTTIDTAKVPGDGGELRLMRRGAEYSIMSGPTELMNSRQSGSEEALATLVCERLHPGEGVHILVGGYGMGFTLRAALKNLPASARITVAELVPAVLAWARGPMAHIAQGCLADPRVTVHQGDVARAIIGPPARFDAILLDVDNGPEGLSRAANDRLYDEAGLAAARLALRPKGILAVWSSSPDQRFTQRLKGAGFAVEEVGVRARAGKGSRHVIWLARAPA